MDRWRAGHPVGRSRGAQALARRLLDAGLAHPRFGHDGSPPEGSVAIVIPVRDDASGLATTLQSLAVVAPAVPVVVVDDGSAVPAVASDSGLRLVRRSASGGPGAARNTGRSELGAWTSVDFVVFVDAGCSVSPGWLAALLPHFADPRVAAVAPRVRNRAVAGTRSDLAAYEDAHSPLDMGSREAGVRPFGAVPYVPTAVLAVRLEAFDSLGGFDESLRYGEDVDLTWRLSAAGWAVRYEPAVEATHPGRTSLSRWLRQRFDYGRSATPLAARHGRAVAPVAVSPWSAAVWALIGTGHPVAGGVVAGLSGAALARRAGGDRATAEELARLALAGHLKAAGPLATGVRRAWLPLFGMAAGVAGGLGGRSARRWLAATAIALLAGGGLAEWWRLRPPAGPATWVGLGLADDLAYQVGVWAGAVAERSAGALLPRW